MCGRFTQLYTWAEVYDAMNLIPAKSNLEPRYHICPTQQIDVVVETSVGRELQRMRWGLAPSWWKKPLNKLPATFNARAETVHEKPMFRSAFKSRRCIIPASGWYEWQDTESGKQPWYFTPANAPIAMIAGLWETWTDPEAPKETVRSATMIITEPNMFVAQYHDRMPVLLDRSKIAAWLNGEKGLELLKPAPERALKAWTVSRAVNSSRAKDEPRLIERMTLIPD